jgi:tRNA nucleotidyltransferase (CCA-adding enzyme)
MSPTEQQLATWTKPAFGNEEELADRTEATIRQAIKLHPTLANLDIRILPKGSFKSNTNVRRASDIDIAVIHQSHIVTEYTDGATREDAGLVPYTGLSREEGISQPREKR